MTYYLRSFLLLTWLLDHRKPSCSNFKIYQDSFQLLQSSSTLIGSFEQKPIDRVSCLSSVEAHCSRLWFGVGPSNFQTATASSLSYFLLLNFLRRYERLIPSFFNLSWRDGSVSPEQVLLFPELSRKSFVLNIDFITAGFAISLFQSTELQFPLNVVTFSFSVHGFGFVVNAFQKFQVVLSKRRGTVVLMS